MSVITQRQVARDASANNVADTILWGFAEDGALIGGTQLSAEIDNKTSAVVLTVTVWVQTVPGGTFTALATTIPCAASTQTNIGITGLAGHAMRLTGKFVAAITRTVTTSVQVQS